MTDPGQPKMIMYPLHEAASSAEGRGLVQGVHDRRIDLRQPLEELARASSISSNISLLRSRQIGGEPLSGP